MKKLFLAAILLAASNLSAKAFEGTVKYRMGGKDGKGGHVMTMAVKDGKIRTESQGMGGQDGKGAAIMDLKAKKMTMLMPEQKKYMVHKLDGQAAAGKTAKGSLKKSGKSETIAGYKAEEWVYESEGKQTSLWGSTELGSFEMGGGPKGNSGGMQIPAELREKGFFLLRMSAQHEGKSGMLEAIEVKPGSLDASLFEVPAGYTEMKGMMGGGGMPPETMEKMKSAMKDMSPEQRKMMEKMMQGQGH